MAGAAPKPSRRFLTAQEQPKSRSGGYKLSRCLTEAVQEALAVSEPSRSLPRASQEHSRSLLAALEPPRSLSGAC